MIYQEVNRHRKPYLTNSPSFMQTVVILRESVLVDGKELHSIITLQNDFLWLDLLGIK